MMSEEKDCERCGKLIPAKRLEVLPFTWLCVECGEAIGGDFKTYVIAENTHGKSGSIKKNYGSWKVKRRLRAITPIDKE
jgi:ribosomal protein L37AE/L43A